jgi:L-rhamnose isomerase/sugar isomerase
MLVSAEAIIGAFAKALIVDREALLYAQESNDVMMAFQALRQAYRTDVSSLIAQVRVDSGGAIDVLGAFRASGWRKTQARRRQKLAPGTGIV